MAGLDGLGHGIYTFSWIVILFYYDLSWWRIEEGVLFSHHTGCLAFLFPDFLDLRFALDTADIFSLHSLLRLKRDLGTAWWL